LPSANQAQQCPSSQGEVEPIRKATVVIMATENPQGFDRTDMRGKAIAVRRRVAG